MQNASQLARAPGAVRSKGFIREGIKLASLGVALDRSVELLRIERLEPRAKPRQLVRVKLFDGFLDVFGSDHADDIAFVSNTEKGLGACQRGVSGWDQHIGSVEP